MGFSEALRKTWVVSDSLSLIRTEEQEWTKVAGGGKEVDYGK